MGLSYAVHISDDNDEYSSQGIRYYEGFCQASTPHSPPEGAALLCCVMNEGDPDWWWLEAKPKVGLDNLAQFYKNHQQWVVFHYRLFREVNIDEVYANAK